MTESQLSQVKNFKIENEHGQIQWEDFTDLTYVDLGDIVTINSTGLVEVYDDERHKLMKPANGNKLNKGAMVTVKKCGLKGKSFDERQN